MDDDGVFLYFRVFAIVEYQYCGIGRIAQWQRQLVHVFLVVKDDRVRTNGCEVRGTYASRQSSISFTNFLMALYCFFYLIFVSFGSIA